MAKPLSLLALLLSARSEPKAPHEPPTNGSTEITSSRQMSLHGSVSIDSSNAAAAANDQNWANKNAAVQRARTSLLVEFTVSKILAQIGTKKIVSLTAQPGANTAKTLHKGGHSLAERPMKDTANKCIQIKSPPKKGRAFKNLPEVGLEPTHSCLRLILSQLRLPFRHSGLWVG